MMDIAPIALAKIVGGRQAPVAAPLLPELACGSALKQETAQIDAQFPHQLAAVSVYKVAEARFHRCLRDVKSGLEGDLPKK
jgi:hypothetical protein